jgi:uncharacterized repeat protein (TIGR01451 family)
VAGPTAEANTASIIHSDQFDPNPGNNSAGATETPQRADLVLSKSVNDATPAVGDTITYTVTLSNDGPDAATSVQVTDRLPAGVSFVSAAPSQGMYDPTSGLWTVGTVTTTAPQTLLIQATVVSPGSQTNTATITHADQFDPSRANNAGSVVVMATPEGPPVSPPTVVPPVSPPSVTSLQRFGFHAQPTAFVLTFSSALDPTRAQDPHNYKLKPVELHGHAVGNTRIVSAVYNPLAHTVTLQPATRLYLFQRYMLVVNGMPPAGLGGPTGVLLDGRGNGIPGSDYVRIFGPAILAGPYRRAVPKLNHKIRHVKSTHPHSSATPARSPQAESGRRLERRHRDVPNGGLGRLPADAVDAVLGTLAGS